MTFGEALEVRPGETVFARGIGTAELVDPVIVKGIRIEWSSKDGGDAYFESDNGKGSFHHSELAIAPTGRPAPKLSDPITDAEAKTMGIGQRVRSRKQINAGIMPPPLGPPPFCKKGDLGIVVSVTSLRDASGEHLTVAVFFGHEVLNFAPADLELA